jgi:hypothetical protein
MPTITSYTTKCDLTSDTGAHPPLAQNGDASYALTAKSSSEEASP